MHMYEIQNVGVSFIISCPVTEKSFPVFTSENSDLLFLLPLLDVEVVTPVCFSTMYSLIGEPPAVH